MPVDANVAKAIFMTALEKNEPAERAAYVSEACGNDSALRQRVEILLKAHEDPGSFMKSPLAGSAAAGVATLDEPITERPGTIIGPYKLLEQIGEGGFGVVYMAEQQAPIRRKVALKVLKPGMDTRQVVARFEAERQALALMDHPNIAKVFDGGSTPSGRPYFVMELVRGVPITDFCDQKQQTPRQRLELFASACAAVQHAHQKGIIHRDLKPSNVLVAVRDGTPLVKIIDFGVAKALGQELTDKTLFTGFAQMIGTPLYMSPEQAGHSLDIDTRSDIYSLGVLLYELLTGSTPLTKHRLQKAAYDEIRRIIREEEPPKPSTRLSDSKDSLPSISAQRQMEPAKLTKLLRGELDWIVMKCLEKDRNRRYETANGLVHDIERYLHDEPVQACPPSAAYRLQKFVRRNKGPVLAGSLVVLALVGGVIGTTTGLILADRARGREEAQRIEAENQAELARQNEKTAKEREAETKAVLDFVENKIFAAARPKDQESGLGYDVKLADAVKAALPFVEKTFSAQPLIEARLRMTMGLSFWYLGDARTAIEQHEKARALYTKHRGPYHPDTLSSMHNLANTFADAGRDQEALQLREEILQLRRTHLGPDHPDTLKGMHSLAESYRYAGRHAEAVKLNEETTTLRKAKLGPDHPDTLSSMHNLAASYYDAGRTHEALKLFEETLPLFEAKLGPDHPDTLKCINNTAACYNSVGRTQEALQLREKLLPLSKAKLGPDHRDTLTRMSNLAESYRSAGRTQEALQLVEETLRLRKAKLGDDHPDTLRNMNHLAYSLIQAGEAAKAAAILHDTLTLRERRAKHEPSNSEAQTYLAWTHGQIGEAEQARLNYAAAVQAYAVSVAMFEKLNPAGWLGPYIREKLNLYRQRLALCRKAEHAVRDLAFVLQQPAGEVPGLLDLRVRFLLKEQKLSAAVETAAKIKERAGDKAAPLYDAACAYALCAGAANQAKSPVAGAPDFEELAGEALALLQRAVANGFKNATHMRQDKDLEALRQRDDFKKLLAGLEASGVKK
jgi:serine/threonine protein kinase/tetratricopeptide (TPR) repeat protein